MNVFAGDDRRNNRRNDINSKKASWLPLAKKVGRRPSGARERRLWGRSWQKARKCTTYGDGSWIACQGEMGEAKKGPDTQRVERVLPGR